MRLASHVEAVRAVATEGDLHLLQLWSCGATLASADKDQVFDQSSIINNGMVMSEARVVTKVTSVIMVVSLPYFRQRMVP